MATKLELPEVRAVKVPVPPLTMLHAPVPTAGVLPPSPVEVSVPQWPDLLLLLL
ncbi:MAG: hypothetical protein IPF68_19725 [Bacteroidales bacterium]|nr:hypothetical protein [Bacteroidales bacterium]